jgi:cell wall-associated NlpC family hydrolase
MRALAVARRYVGVPYVWGGESPNGFDCSGLVQFAYAKIGVSVPRVTYAQWYAGRHVSRSQLRAGDLVFFHHHSHVGLFVGHGWFLAAPQTGSRVHISPMANGWYNDHYDGAVRIG